MSLLPVSGQEHSSSSFIYLDLKMHWRLEFSPCLELCPVFTGEVITQFSLLQAELLLRGIEKRYIYTHTHIYFNLYLRANWGDDESTAIIQSGVSKNVRSFWWINILRTSNFDNCGTKKVCHFLSCGCLIPELEGHELFQRGFSWSWSISFPSFWHLMTQVSLNWLAQDVTKQTPPSKVQFAIASITKAVFTIIKCGGKLPLPFSQVFVTTFFFFFCKTASHNSIKWKLGNGLGS